MILRLASSALVSVVLAIFLSPLAAAQSSAKALFNGPAPSTTPPFGPVGIQYWFENEQGTRFAQARDAGVGARVRMHIQSNTLGFLTVWLTDRSQEAGIQLTPMQGQWAGYLLEPRRDYVVPGEITVPAAGSDTRILVLFARSQTEQVPTAADAREKVRRLSVGVARDGALAIVQETDTSTPGQAGTYVVHRMGAQPGVEIEIGQ
jgi:hypothetical protein